MPVDDDTRYTSTDPPSLETVQAMLESLASVEASRNSDGSRTRLVFEIDAVKLHEKGYSCYATGERIAAVMRKAIGRLLYFDGVVTKACANADKQGTTVADIQAFINNELKHVPPTGDLASSMRRRMYGETLQKLVELGTWRAAVDAQRFRKAFEEESKRRAEQEERTRSAKEAERKRRAQEEAFRSSFEDAFSGYWEEVFYRGDFAGPFGKQQRQEESRRPKARNKDRAPWYEVLGVSSNADKATIKSAWRKLSSILHPDKPENRNDPEKLERLKDVNTAKDEGLRGLA